MGRPLLAMILGLAAAGCATRPGDESRWRWHYRTSDPPDPGRPVALYGPAAAGALLVLECVPAARAIAFRAIDSDLFEGERPIRIDVGAIRFDGTQRLESDTGMAIARTMIPLDHPLVAVLAAGRGPIRTGAGGAIPTGSALVRMVRACRG